MVISYEIYETQQASYEMTIYETEQALYNIVTEDI